MKLHTLDQFASGHQFLEALRWHDGKLWASDFFSKQVLTFEPDGSTSAVAEIPGAPSGIGFLDDGSTLVVSQKDALIQRISSDGTVDTYADFSGLAGGIANDLLVTSAGHAYAGNFGFALGEEDPKPTNLAHIDPQGTVRRVDGDVTFPNGMGVTADGTLLVQRRSHIESPRSTSSRTAGCPTTECGHNSAMRTILTVSRLTQTVVSGSATPSRSAKTAASTA